MCFTTSDRKPIKTNAHCAKLSLLIHGDQSFAISAERVPTVSDDLTLASPKKLDGSANKKRRARDIIDNGL